MAGTTLESRLPTLDRLGATLPLAVESTAAQIAYAWFNAFASAAESQNIDGILALFCDESLWRDVYAMTWDIRTFDGSSNIRPFLQTCIPTMKIQSFKWKDFVRFQRPYPDLAWILVMFDFETTVGLCTCVARLVPTSSGAWQAFTIFTNLEDLKGFPELIGPSRKQEGIPGTVWKANREAELAADPIVLIVGGGQSGLALAARLKYLNVPALVVEKDMRIGDSWRRRYDSLCLHFPIWYDNMPYLPFPPTWPKYTPGLKMADWLESYASILDLNVWTSSKVLNATQDANEKWHVRVEKGNGDVQTFFVNHLVIATGQGDGIPRMPDIPNKEQFKGPILHSSQYKRASEFQGKRVVVIGTGNSGHDIAADLARSQIDVTMYQRSPTLVFNLDKAWKFMGGSLYSEGSPPNSIADQLQHSMPHLLLEGGIAQRNVKDILADQKEALDALRSVGFKLNAGIRDAGILLNLKQKCGGHYFDIGASQLIIDGHIKLKNDSPILCFDNSGLAFADGSHLHADAIICATGSGDMRQFIKHLCGEAVASECPPLIGVDKEGEMTWFRPLPRKGLWYFHGPLSLIRFHSKHLAMYIKAVEENLITTRYASTLGPDCIVLR